jgi:hypothetical protein
MNDQRNIMFFILAVVVIVGFAELLIIGIGSRRSAAVVEPGKKEIAADREILSQKTPESTDSEDGEEVKATSPVEENEIIAPTPREGLVSSDPGSVHLASGEIQLVEFFAFW